MPYDGVRNGQAERLNLSRPGGEPGIGRRLYKWDAKLLTLEDQQSFFYSITNGYLFRLKIDALPIASKRTTFRATLIGPDDLRLESQTVLEPKKVEETLPPPED